MISDIRLIIADIDSTLVREDRVFTPGTKQALDRCRAHGIMLGIASGRSVDQQLIYEAANWGFDAQFDCVIGMNGSELWDNPHQARHDYYKLKREWIKEIVELLAPLNLNPFMYWHDKMLCLRVDTETRASSERNKAHIQVANDPSDLWAEENAKIMFRMPEEMIPQAEALVRAHPQDNWKAVKTQTTMLEFTDKRVSKAVALKKFCEANDLPLETVMAFGDMENDDEMLKVSGWGVCMLNGSQETKDISDDITRKTNDEDGLADYLEQKVLNPQNW